MDVKRENKTKRKGRVKRHQIHPVYTKGIPIKEGRESRSQKSKE